MTPPKARCVTCLTVIADHDPRTTNQRPKYCKNPACRKAWNDRPICGRCREPMQRPFHSAQRFHEWCRDGCAFCGKDLPLHPKDFDREVTHQPKRMDTALDHLYCSKECRNAAWADQPMPICPYCNSPTEFNPKAKIWRNPPLYHDECRPDGREYRKRIYKFGQWFWEAYLEHKVCKLMFSKDIEHNCHDHIPFEISDETLQTFDMDEGDYYPNEDFAYGGWLRREDDHPSKPVHEGVGRYHRNQVYIVNRQGLVLPWVQIQTYFDRDDQETKEVPVYIQNNAAAL